MITLEPGQPPVLDEAAVLLEDAALPDVPSSPAPPEVRPSVLVVDDEEAVAMVLARGLSYSGYSVSIALGGREALECLAQQPFDAMLTDIHMPRLRGDEMQRIARERYPDLAVLLITAANETAVAVECLKEGVFDYMTKPFDLADVTVRVGKALEKQRLIRENRAYQDALEGRVLEQAQKLKKTMKGSLEALIFALEAKDPNTRNHSVRVSHLAAALAARLQRGNAVLHEQVRIAALFHDIGKIGVPEAILNKEGCLSQQERDWIRRHPEIGETILHPLLDPEPLAFVRHHHEHFDGKGYPDGFSGSEIPLGARIIAVADAFDAMNSTRPYRREICRHHVLEIVGDGAGTQWDPQVVHALLQMAADGQLDELGEGHDNNKPRPAPDVKPTIEILLRQSEFGAAMDADGFARSLRPAPPLEVALPDSLVTTISETHELVHLPVPAITPAEKTAPAATAREALRHVLFLAGRIDAPEIHCLRLEVEKLLQEGGRNIYLDLINTESITPESAQSVYALDLRARRANARLILRDAPTVIVALFQQVNLARMLRFENSPLFGRNAVSASEIQLLPPHCPEGDETP